MFLYDNYYKSICDILKVNLLPRIQIKYLIKIRANRLPDWLNLEKQPNKNFDFKFKWN